MPATTVARNASFPVTDSAGQMMVAARFPLNAIQVPAFAPEQRTIAVDLQQPTTMVPRRICSFTFAASGFPA